LYIFTKKRVLPMRSYLALTVITLFTLHITSCNEGLAPQPEPEPTVQEGFGGKVFFNGEWNTGVTRTHLIVFRNPVTTPDDFSLTNIAYVSSAIPYGVTEYNYSTADTAMFPPNSRLSAGTYSFIVVAQQTTAELTLNGADWFIRGFYASENPAVPGAVTVPPEGFVNDINIYCNFNSPLQKQQE
jgi:hypothetical protein